jgi:hypothetical protein
METKDSYESEFLRIVKEVDTYMRSMLPAINFLAVDHHIMDISSLEDAELDLESFGSSSLEAIDKKSGTDHLVTWITERGELLAHMKKMLRNARRVEDDYKKFRKECEKFAELKLPPEDH